MLDLSNFLDLVAPLVELIDSTHPGYSVYSLFSAPCSSISLSKSPSAGGTAFILKEPAFIQNHSVHSYSLSSAASLSSILIICYSGHKLVPMHNDALIGQSAPTCASNDRSESPRAGLIYFKFRQRSERVALARF